MKNTSLKCPVCGTEKKLFLKSDTVMLIMNCTECRTLLLHYKKQTFQLDKDEIKNTIKKGNISRIQELIEILYRQQSKSRHGKISQFTPPRVTAPPVKRKQPKTNPADKAVRPDPISKQDVIDLVIDINTATSVSEFLKKLR